MIENQFFTLSFIESFSLLSGLAHILQIVCPVRMNLVGLSTEGIYCSISLEFRHMPMWLVRRFYGNLYSVGSWKVIECDYSFPPGRGSEFFHFDFHTRSPLPLVQDDARGRLQKSFHSLDKSPFAGVTVLRAGGSPECNRVKIPNLSQGGTIRHVLMMTNSLGILETMNPTDDAHFGNERNTWRLRVKFLRKKAYQVIRLDSKMRLLCELWKFLKRKR